MQSRHLLHLGEQAAAFASLGLLVARFHQLQILPSFIHGHLLFRRHPGTPSVTFLCEGTIPASVTFYLRECDMLLIGFACAIFNIVYFCIYTLHSEEQSKMRALYNVLLMTKFPSPR